MTVPALLAELRRRDVEIWADGRRLRCAAPPGALTPDLRETIRRRRSEILQLLRAAEALDRQPRAVVPLEPGGRRTPVFAVAGHNGDVFCYRDFAQHLGDGQPFFGLEPPGLDGRSAPLTRVEELAAYFADQIGAFRPRGPCIIAGYCAGGTVAFELGRLLLQAGRSIPFVALLGSPFPAWYRTRAQVAFRIRRQYERARRHARALWSLPAADRLRYLTGTLHQIRARREAERAAALDPVLARRARVERATLAALRRYRPHRFAGRVALFAPSRDWLPSSLRQWRSMAERTSEYFGPDGCLGDTMLCDHAPAFARLFRRCREEHEDESAASDPLLHDRLLALSPIR